MELVGNIYLLKSCMQLYYYSSYTPYASEPTYWIRFWNNKRIACETACIQNIFRYQYSRNDGYYTSAAKETFLKSGDVT